MYYFRSPAQAIVALLTAAFVIFVLSTAYLRSAEKMGTKINTNNNSSPQTTSELHIQDFERVAVKKGRRVWEVRAVEAKYYSTENQARLANSTMKMYRPDGSIVTVTSTSGKLYLRGEAIVSADVQGDVVIGIDESTKIYTDLAVYDADQDKISAAGPVKIVGQGYTINGIGMTVEVANRLIEISSTVNSQFISKVSTQ
ncbi:LPS export ABC transporter periplasmic protein LptC [bacterium]|nr:LPS export ABC transporter periplasmic protein LptC [bacterium]